MADDFMSILPPVLAADERFRTLEKIHADRLNAIDLTLLVPRMTDMAPVAMLPYVAEEFGVANSVAWHSAVASGDVAQQRKVIRQAIVLRKHAGTVWALEEALRQLEIEPTVLEWFDTGAPRATFSISADCFTQSVTPALYEAVVATALQAKNARSLLTGVELVAATRGAGPMLGASVTSAVVISVYPRSV